MGWLCQRTRHFTSSDKSFRRWRTAMLMALLTGKIAGLHHVGVIPNHVSIISNHVLISQCDCCDIQLWNDVE